MTHRNTAYKLKPKVIPIVIFQVHLFSKIHFYDSDVIITNL